MTGGWCPPGCRSEDGLIPSRYNLQETPDFRIPDAQHIPRSQRTAWNVRDSDATLIFWPNADAGKGTEFTLKIAEEMNKPYFLAIHFDDSVGHKALHWILDHQIGTLNVAGPPASAIPGIGEEVYTFLCKLFQNL